MNISKVNKILGILSVLMIGFIATLFIVMTSDKEYMAQVGKEIEASKNEKKMMEARKVFASKMSDKFELPHGGRCVASFYVEGKENKTLYVRPCSLLTGRGEEINLHKLFDKETMQEVKRLGFTRMETDEGDKRVYLPIE